MTWFYVSNGQQAGPVDDAQLADLVRTGAIQPDTLVWREGMANWQPWRAVAGPPPPLPPPVTEAEAAPVAVEAPAMAGGTTPCSVCGQLFPDSELVMVGTGLVCASCKPVALQRLQQGTWTRGNRRYAGFWIRFAALFVDGLILAVAGALAALPLGLNTAGDGPEAIIAMFTSFGVSSLINMAIGVAYYAYFLTQNGATPGKMVFGLQVIRSDGSGLTVGRAIARYFAPTLSGLILFIGYLMAAFDAEKRTLHDHICDTRVIYKN